MAHRFPDSGAVAPPDHAADSGPASFACPAAEPTPPPPHLLWATLESAYTAPEQGTASSASPISREERLPRYLGLPIALGISLVLWVIIVELVLMR